MRMITSVLLILIIVSLVTPLAHALTVYHGVDTNITHLGRLTNTPNATTAYDAFRSLLPSVGPEIFEGRASNSIITDVNFAFTNPPAMNVTATLSGEPKVFTVVDPDGHFNGYNPVSGTNALRLEAWSNGVFTVQFSTPQSAFGFFGVDLADAPGVRLQIAIERSNGPSSRYTIPADDLPSASVLFWGVIDRESPFTRVVFSRIPTNAGDNFMFDDLVIARPEDVLSPPTSITIPPSRFVALGDRMTLSVSVDDGTAPFAYQWLRNGINISGANTSSFEISSFSSEDAATYQVAVSNAAGGALSAPFSLSLLDLEIYSGITITGPPGERYCIEFTPEVQGPANWQNLTNFVLPSSPFLWIDPTPARGARRFYRVTPLPFLRPNEVSQIIE